MSRRYYAGIGSRETPIEVQRHMFQVGKFLARKGYTLRTGGADGADNAFLEGCRAGNGKVELWLPWQGFNGHRSEFTPDRDEFYQIASLLHPAWKGLKDSVKRLHSRNVGQILGEHFDAEKVIEFIANRSPVAIPLPDVSEFVLCWTPDGSTGEKTSSATGGTGMAIRVAYSLDIPIYNDNDFKPALRKHLSL